MDDALRFAGILLSKLGRALIGVTKWGPLCSTRRTVYLVQKTGHMERESDHERVRKILEREFLEAVDRRDLASFSFNAVTKDAQKIFRPRRNRRRSQLTNCNLCCFG